MRKLLSHISLCVLLLFTCSRKTDAQTGIYVPANGKVFFVGDSAAMFSDISIRGVLGIGNKAVLNFMGSNWENDPLSQLSDESAGGLGYSATGGTIRFMGQNRQTIRGGYNPIVKFGPAFGKLTIDNINGVALRDGIIKVGREVEFKNGLIFLNDQAFVIGNNSPGKISGYDNKHFFVTGNASSTGLLIREQLTKNDGLVVFPIGTSAEKYTPAAVKVQDGQKDDVHIGAFSKTLSGGTTGTEITDNSVNTTWEIGKRNPTGEMQAEISLQHRNADEGTSFAANRDRSYISQHQNNRWDTASPVSAPGPATLTSGSMTPASGINKRSVKLKGGPSLAFTKLVLKDISDTTKVYFNGYRRDIRKVELNWVTYPEVQVKYFIITRRLSNENSFIPIDTVASKAPNGFSDKQLFYNLIDPDNSDKGISYYQLIWVDYNGNYHYSYIIAISNRAGGNEFLLWPNPSRGEFRVGVNGYTSIKTIVIWDALGQKVAEEPANGRSIIVMRLRTPGTYFVGYISNGDQLMETKKLLIVPYN